MSARLHYRGSVYVVEDGHWRGRDGHGVHLLTWITDDLARGGERLEEISDAEVAERVAERLGEEAEVVGGAGR